MQDMSHASRPWYREPWPWILMAGPALAVVGCLITIYLAVTRYADEPVVEGAVRHGLVVQRLPAALPAPGPAASSAASPAALHDLNKAICPCDPPR